MAKVSRGESLDRYYLFKLWGYGLFLHKIHHSDPVGLYHTHPWNGISFHWRSYTELTFDPDRKALRIWGRYFANYLPAKRYHSVIIGDKSVWTLFFHWPKCNTWSVIDDNGNKVDAPWEGEGTGRSYSKALTENPNGQNQDDYLEESLNDLSKVYKDYEVYAILAHTEMAKIIMKRKAPR